MASGDLHIPVTFEQNLTGPQAAAFAQALIDCGAWTGSLAHVRNVYLERRASGTPYVSGNGILLVAPSALAAYIAANGPVNILGSEP